MQLTPQEYFEKIRELRNPEEIKALCQELRDYLYPDKDNKNKNKATPYNKLINTLTNEELIEGENAFIYTKQDGSLWKRHLHFKYVGLSSEEWSEINRKTIVLDRLEDCQKINVASYLETTIKLSQSDDYNELAVGLVAASGRRPYEIWVQGQFTILDQLPDYLKPGYFVNFKGQLKKRDSDISEDEKTEYRIGLLVPAQFFLGAFNRLRKSTRVLELKTEVKKLVKQGLSETDIEKKISDSVTPQMRRVIQNNFIDLPKRQGDKDINNKSLRAAYTRLITDRDCPKNIVSVLWASRSVGHFIDNQKPDDSQLSHLVTTLGYLGYYADTDVPFVTLPEKKKVEKAMQVRVTSEDFGFIKDLQDKWELPNQQTVVTQLIKKADEVEHLKRQIMDAQAQINDLQKQLEEKSTMEAQPQIQAIDKNLLREMMVEILTELQPTTPQSQPSTSTATATATPSPTPTIRKPKPELDYESMGNDELKKLRSDGAVDEKIRRAFLAITDFNDAQPSNATRWAITNQSLRQVSGCNGQKVREWMEHNQGSVNDHNNKYQFKFITTELGQSMCLQNKGKGDITQVIHW